MDTAAHGAPSGRRRASGQLLASTGAVAMRRWGNGAGFGARLCRDVLGIAQRAGHHGRLRGCRHRRLAARACLVCCGTTASTPALAGRHGAVGRAPRPAAGCAAAGLMARRTRQ